MLWTEVSISRECSASGTIKELSGKGSIGGLIGELGKAAKITYSHADVALDVKSDYYGGANVGGLIGKGNGKNDPETVISNCYATGNVTGGAYSGGFAGSLYGLNIKKLLRDRRSNGRCCIDGDLCRNRRF